VNAGDVKAALGTTPSARVIPIRPDVLPAAPAAPGAPIQPDAIRMPAGRWARYAGKLGGALTVTVSAASIRRGGHEPNEPEDSDVELLQEALEEGLRLKFGDTDVPWWLGAALAAGGVYAGMRIGARKLPPEIPAHKSNAEPSPSTPRSTPVAPPRGPEISPPTPLPPTTLTPSIFPPPIGSTRT
jgi:hypothetical protein